MRCSPACLSVSLAALLVGVPCAQEPDPPQPQPPPPQQQQQQRGDAESAEPARQATPRQRPRPADTKALLATFARMPGLEATYEEEKRLQLLALPLRSKGRIRFLPPGYLHREVEAPERATLRITPDELQIVDRDGEQRVDLARDDALRAFVTALVRVFAGDHEALQKAFTLTYTKVEGEERGWSLRLVPKGEQLQRLLKELVLRGEGEAVTEIDVLDPNGDRTVTRIVTADVARRFDAEERERWFGIEPR